MTIQETIQQEEGVVAYFSTKTCNVCKVLKPKVKTMLAERFPKMNFVYVDTEESPETAGQHLVFAVPTIMVFFQGRETGRFSRSLSMAELEDAIARPYDMVF